MHEDSFHHPVKDRSNNILVSGPERWNPTFELVLLVASCSIVAPAFLHLDSLLKCHHPEKGLTMAEIPSIQEQVQKAVFHLGASKACLIRLFYHIYVFVHNSEVPTHDPYGIMASICSQLVNTVKSRFHANFHKYFGYHPNFCCFHCHIELFGYLMAFNHHTFPKPSDPWKRGIGDPRSSQLCSESAPLGGPIFFRWQWFQVSRGSG